MTEFSALILGFEERGALRMYLPPSRRRSTGQSSSASRWPLLA